MDKPPPIPKDVPELRASDHVRMAREAMKARRSEVALSHLMAARRIIQLRESTKKNKLAAQLITVLIDRLTGKPDKESL